MTAPVQPKKPLDRARYQRMRDAGFSDEQIAEDGFELPGGFSTDRSIPIGERLKSAVASPEFKDRLAGSAQMALPAVAIPGAVAALRAAPTKPGVGGLAKRALETLFGGSGNTQQGLKAGVKRLATNVSSNAAMGGLSAAASGQDVGSGAAIGALAGAIPSVAEAAVGTKNVVSNRLNPDVRATQRMGLLGASNDDAGDLAQRLAQRAATDPDAVLADVTERRATAALERAVRLGGKEGSITQAEMGRRAEEALDPKRVIGMVAKAGGVDPSEGLIGAKQGVEDAMRPDISAKFKSSVDNASQTFDDPALQVLLRQDDPEIQKAAKRAFAHTATRRAATGGSVEFDEDGIPIYRGADFFDALRKELGKIEQSYRGGAQPDLGAADAVRMRKSEVESLLRKGLGPDYGEGIALSAENATVQEAMDLGRQLARGGDDAIKDADVLFRQKLKLGKATPDVNNEVYSAYRAGAAQEVISQLEQAKSPEALLELLASSPRQEQVLEFAIPDPRERAVMLSEINKGLEKMYRARRLAGAEPIPELERPDAFGRLTPWAAAQVMRGSPTLAAAQEAGTIWTRLQQHRQRKGAQELAALARAKIGNAQGQVNPEILRALTAPRRQTITTRPAVDAARVRSVLSARDSRR